MLPEPVLDRALNYVSGAMNAPEREGFEVVLTFHQELRTHVAGLQEVMTTMAMSKVPPQATPPAALKLRLLASLDGLAPRPAAEALVVTSADGRLEWANPVFTAMCGYTLAELRGRKPGHVLQGPETDLAAVQRIREAVRVHQACEETLVNYHKDGSRYRVKLRILPVLDDEGRPLWLAAKERQVPMIGAGV
jgi:PAS domain S-box-containing protein